jgi:hypothetical protein
MLIALILALTQQPDTFVTDSSARPIPANRPTYVITAKLDEERQKLEGHAWLTYVNAHPDTLRELYFHQYLNAFRPGSKWSERDAREGRVRFQNLKEPNFGYERFTVPPKVNGVAVAFQYPAAPDSTVVKLVLDTPVMPGDTILVEMRWDARPSTVARRQGRRGRSWDFAQWYPKIAVVDNGGWEPNALIPAGELYGEFGDYDVTMILRDDQVVGGTGVVVDGDPGWARVSKSGAPYMTSTIGMALPGGLQLDVDVPTGYRKVRFHADDVHHFAFSVSPEYRYEGGVFVRQQLADAGARSPGMQPGRKAAWDTVAIHVLYRPGDDAVWGGGVAVGRTHAALEWLQRVYGDYAYPQLTNLHRLDGGGTEFPMAIMDGSASQGLIMHEGGHVYTYGILANNEWRSGWMDEGLTSYQTSWFTGNTPQDRGLRGGRDEVTRAKGYRGRVRSPSGIDNNQLALYRIDIIGRTEPIGTRADQFSEFGIYNTMIYDRAEMMYGALRDAVGDSAFTRFLHSYYRDWRFRHVDERAMRTTVEREVGQPLGWFFDQWLRHTGLLDYELKSVKTTRAADGGGTWITRGRVRRTGDYHHPMPLGALTSAGWVIARGEPLADDQWIEVRTAEKPRAVRLDPLRTTEDWDRRNDVVRRLSLNQPKEEKTARNTIDLPFLDQTDRDHLLNLYAPVVWASTANGFVGGIRQRSSYQNLVDRQEFGIVRTSRERPVSAVVDTFPMKSGIAYTRPLPEFGIPALPVEVAQRDPWLARTQYWWTLENPRLPWRDRPAIGLRSGVWSLDGVFGAELGYSWDASPFYYAKTRTTTRLIQATLMMPAGFGYLPARWQNSTVSELRFSEATRLWRGLGPRLAYSASLGYATKGPSSGGGAAYAGGTYARGTLAMQVGRSNADSSVVGSIRLFGGASTAHAPLQRRVYASSQDPYETFSSNLVRPAGGLLAQPDAHFVPLGGAGLRAYDPRMPLREVAAVNVETGQRLATLAHTPKALTLWASVFGDAGVGRLLTNQTRFLADGGVGLSLRGWYYDREVRLRLDAPLITTNFYLADRDPSPRGQLRWQFSLTDIW